LFYIRDGKIRTIYKIPGEMKKYAGAMAMIDGGKNKLF